MLTLNGRDYICSAAMNMYFYKLISQKDCTTITLSVCIFFIMGWRRARPLASTSAYPKVLQCKICVCVCVHMCLCLFMCVFGPFTVLSFSVLSFFDHEEVDLEQLFFSTRPSVPIRAETRKNWKL